MHFLLVKITSFTQSWFSLNTFAFKSNMFYENHKKKVFIFLIESNIVEKIPYRSIGLLGGTRTANSDLRNYHRKVFFSHQIGLLNMANLIAVCPHSKTIKTTLFVNFRFCSRFSFLPSHLLLQFLYLHRILAQRQCHIIYYRTILTFGCIFTFFPIAHFFLK